MHNLSRASLVTWIAFLMFLGLALPDAKLRIYWVWTVVSLLAVGGLFWGLKVNRLRPVVTVAATILLITYIAYWLAVSSMYPQLQGTALLAQYLEDWSFVLRGNFQQGHVWLALTMIYVQVLMPVLQVVLLVATFFVPRPGTSPA